jgi:hypothetical protein
MTPSKCVAYQVSDQMTCPRCGLTWDKNDPNPPDCSTFATGLRRPSIPFKAIGPAKFQSGLPGSDTGNNPKR